MTCGIYGIFQGSRVYIGQSVNIERRWRIHKSSLKLNRHHCQFLQRIFNKHGLSSLQFSTLKVCSVSELDTLETQVWEEYQNNRFSMMNPKPEGGVLRGENNPMFGKSGDKNPRFGVTLTDGTKDKMSRSSVKYSYTIEHVKSGEIFTTDNITQWCKNKKVSRSNLHATVPGGSRRTSHGYKIISKVEL